MKRCAELAPYITRLSQRLSELAQAHAPSVASPAPETTAQPDLADLAREAHELRLAIEELQTAEDELEEQNRALCELHERLECQRRKYYQLFHEAPDSYLVTDLGGNILEANRAAAEMLNVDLRELTRKPLVLYVAGHHHPRYWAHINAFTKGSSTKEFELTMGPRKRPPLDVSLRVAPVLSRSGRPAGLRWVIRDVTPRKAAEDKLQAALLQLQQSERLAAVGMLAAGVAHEIRNPLHAILMAVQCARYSLDGDQHDDILEAIRREVHRVDRISRGLLRFARAEPTSRDLTDLHELLRRVADMVRGYHSGRQVRLVLDLCETLPLLELNRTEIEQVIVQLITNAAEAAPREVQVSIRTHLDPDSVRIFVEDNGPGMPEEHLAQVFNPFFTTRQDEGKVGLGLSIVHSIISGHGGSITAQSHPGRGSTFIIRLPVPGRG